MDSRDRERIRDLLARLVEALSFILDHPELEDNFRYELQGLYMRVAQLQQSSFDPDVVRVMWLEVDNELSRFVHGWSSSGLTPYELRQIVDSLAGRSVAYFTTPPATEGDLRNAVAELAGEVRTVLDYPSPAGGGYEGPALDAPARRRVPPKGHVPPKGRMPVISRSEKPPQPPTRVVNTGFSDRTSPEKGLSSARYLELNTDYWFWVEIGELQRTSIEEVPTTLPGSVPAGAVLTVAVFSFPEELHLTHGGDVGSVRLTDTGVAVVVDQPGDVGYLVANSPISERRLLFPVTTPSRPGQYHLRCNIYYQHVLLQSRIVSAYVAQVPETGRALRSVLDYKLSHTLDPAHLARMGSHRLSLFINRNSDGTHGFLLEGEEGLKTQASLDGQILQDTVTQARKALRRVAWGNADPWQPSLTYRYACDGEPDSFVSDLIALAIRGYLLYSALIDNISGGSQASEKLASLMLKPGRVQISSKESARMVIPAALFYDHPLDTQAKQHRVCADFLKTVRAKISLLDSPCFRGQCPNFDQLEIVCPGGFWGYRHELGLPVSIEHSSAGDAEPDIQFQDPASIVVVVSLDRMFTERDAHEERLKLIRTPLDFTLCNGRKKALAALQRQQAEMIYFYCHGGMSADNTPFLNIGDNEYFTPDNIRSYKIRWNSPRPIVFLNGCMTTALEPEKALDFVSMFVSYARASGVIGTEITVFEALATKFAEAFLSHFMGKCRSIGESIKLARLTLLEQFNPLGLVYIPFALPGLRLVDLSEPDPQSRHEP